MSVLADKKGVIMGVANERSIAAAIAAAAFEAGAQLGFSHLPDDKGKMAARLQKVVSGYKPQLLAPCDVNDDAGLASFFAQAGSTYGSLDFFVHSVAFAPLEDIRCATVAASRAGFISAMETSVYSFIATARAAAALMPHGGSILTLSYFGGEKVVAGYNLMGVAKAALECAVKYLAYDLGPQGIRVNAISAGPLKTLAASAVGDFGDMLGMNAAIAPLGRNITAKEVADTACFLLSPLASGISGENIHVDGGYHVMGSPGRALQTWQVNLRQKA